MKTLEVGYSPCPNDTFLFYALVHERVDTEGYRFVPRLADVETLNRGALSGEAQMTKISYGILGEVRPRYWCLRSGGALGRGCGPLVVARSEVPLHIALHGKVAVPGLHTTANMLLEMCAGHPVERVAMGFRDVMPAVVRGDVDAGVIIHEGRFTLDQYGLVAVADLGNWWEQTTGLPIPLGCILLQRDLPGVDPVLVQRVLRRSVLYALENPEEPMAYVRQHAQEMDEDAVREHISLYVNEFTVDLGREGLQAVETMVERWETNGLHKPWSGPVFPGPVATAQT